jgi:hypothetical protein
MSVKDLLELGELLKENVQVFLDSAFVLVPLLAAGLYLAYRVCSKRNEKLYEREIAALKAEIRAGERELQLSDREAAELRARISDDLRRHRNEWQPIDNMFGLRTLTQRDDTPLLSGAFPQSSRTPPSVERAPFDARVSPPISQDFDPFSDLLNREVVQPVGPSRESPPVAYATEMLAELLRAHPSGEGILMPLHPTDSRSWKLGVWRLTRTQFARMAGARMLIQANLATVTKRSDAEYLLRLSETALSEADFTGQTRVSPRT